jgi:hypothetical protein
MKTEGSSHSILPNEKNVVDNVRQLSNKDKELEYFPGESTDNPITPSNLKIDNKLYFEIFKSIDNTDLAQTKALLDVMPSIDVVPLFIRACRVGYLPIIKLLSKINTEIPGLSLSYICETFNLKVIKYLLDNLSLSECDITFEFNKILINKHPYKYSLIKYFLRKFPETHSQEFFHNSMLNAIKSADINAIMILLKSNNHSSSFISTKEIQNICKIGCKQRSYTCMLHRLWASSNSKQNYYERWRRTKNYASDFESIHLF